MNIKCILFSILTFVATTAFSTENIDPWKPVVFTFAKEAGAPNDKIPILKKTPGSKYNFEPIESDKSEQYVGKPCVFCPFIPSIIVDSNNPDHCDSLAIALLSIRVTALEEQNKNMIKTMEMQSKINQDQSKINQDQSKINQSLHKFDQDQIRINKSQEQFNKVQIELDKDFSRRFNQK